MQHRSRVRRDPSQPNLRQVHLVHAELLDELRARGFRVEPGVIGENVTTRGIALLDLPTGTRLRLGSTAVVEVTGLRNPCVQLDRYQDGLMQALLSRDADGGLVRLAGVMAIVPRGGVGARRRPDRGRAAGPAARPAAAGLSAALASVRERAQRANNRHRARRPTSAAR